MTNKAYASGTVIDSGSLNDFNTATYNLLSTVAGTNTITATGPLSFSAYGSGKDFEFIPAVTNTGAVTININGLGARAITKYGSTALVAGDLVAGSVAKILDDGTRFQLINPQTLPSTYVIPATQGGTGQTSYAIGDLLYASTTTTLAKLPDVATGNVLRSGGVGVAPAWGKVNLTTDVSGVLPLANGGGTGTSASIVVGTTRIQWGSTVTSTNVSGQQAVNFPTAFSGTPYTVVVCNGESLGGNLVVSNVQSLLASTAFAFEVRVGNTGAILASTPVRINWYAVGPA